MAFVKLFSTITASTVWSESHATRIVWITLLAMADAKGRISASVPGLAHIARVTLEEAEHALERFLGPDPYSRTKDCDGRRIEVIDGGWKLINYLKYRETQDEDARKEYQREWDRNHRKRPTTHPTNPTKSDKSDSTRQLTTQEEEEEEVTTLSGKPDAIRVLEHLNLLSGRSFKPVPANLKLIESRLKEASLAEVLAVIDRQAAKWVNDEKMAEYLRPATLFAARNFASYDAAPVATSMKVDL
jgi:uncharacterized phage protein (TIGR02220 family)